MNGDQDDPSCRIPKEYRRRGRDPVDARHRDVRDNDVRRQSPGGGNERLTIGHVRDDVEFRLQERTQQVPGPWVIVGQKEAWETHKLSGMAGVYRGCMVCAREGVYGGTVGEVTGGGQEKY